MVPLVVRALLSLVEERGLSPDRLCMGLGFTYADLVHGRAALSMAQIRQVLTRARQQLPEPGLAIACGARQTPASWGLLGLALYTCETFSEVIEFGMSHQDGLGSLVDHGFEIVGSEVHLECYPRRFDPQVEAFIVEEDFASIVAITRALLGDAFRPLRVEFAFDCEAPSPLYARHFRCPVRFGAIAHRLTFDSHWLGTRLPSFDRIGSFQLRTQLENLVALPSARHDLVETLSAVAQRDGERLRQRELATRINLSERTLRRRLGKLDTSFRTVSDAARYAKAKELLARPGTTIAEVAQAVGYSDARAFRRAFKRWSGELPVGFRERALDSPDSNTR
ncbi:AraC family transcriptional regulator ligand-binding domain-containing protein [Aquimonas sp.]|uniref:AraC family transcriptional regulator n=1 Tax=Aquimonas sp. TaxID=1872588 RepID=UPI0037C079A6